MKTYIVNLARSTDRRSYMEKILSEYPQLDIEFIEAVDGRELIPEEREQIFDLVRFKKETMKIVRPGEIGCTLSHQKCYRKMVDEGIGCALIFEDDLIINENLDSFIMNIHNWLTDDEPRLLLLSGWFWFSSSSPFDNKHRIAKVIDGYLTHSYALNNSAAKMMIDQRPWYVADAWDMFIKRGVKIYGLRPHICDQDWSGVFKTVVNDECQQSSYSHGLKSFIRTKKKSLIHRILKLLGKFENPER